MAENVYGVGEQSKSAYRVPKYDEVFTKDNTYSKSEVYNKNETYSEDEADEIFMAKDAGAPKNHASSANTYGLGTNVLYGHVKLTTSLDAPSGDQDGLALAASVGYVLKTYIDTRLAELQPVPVHGVVALDTLYDASDVQAIYGYGTWASSGAISLAGTYIYFYKRTA